MAEIVASAFFGVFFEKLTSQAVKKLARSKGIDSQLNKVERLLKQIELVLNDASEKEISQKGVKEWQNNLRNLAYDIDDFLDELATEAMHREFKKESEASTSKVRNFIPTCCSNFSRSTRMHSKLDGITSKLQELVEAKNILGLTETNEKPKIIRYEASLVDPSGIVGREGDKKMLLQKLLGGKESSDQNFSIVPIVGMGGVGKTTLARLLYDQKEVKDHFEVRAWVCVSDEFSHSTISKVIYQSVTGENKDFADLNLLQEALKEKLKNKLFLIVLDDVWSDSYDDWDKLVGPFVVGAPGSKIIMTTRKQELLKKLGYAHVDLLQSLSHDNALTLFAKHALGVDNFDSYPTLRPHGEGLVKKCDGLPLALRALGRLLRTKTDEEEWKKLLDSEIWSLEQRDEILPALRLSYSELSLSLKQLFAYCSLFPKDYVFDKEELILLWMAEGFLHHSTMNQSMEDWGHECFKELLLRSFFQQAPNDDSLFVMHDLMIDLATSVAGDFFLRLDIGLKKGFFKEKLRHMSFVYQTYMGYKRFEPFKEAKSLRTFLVVGMKESWDKFYLSNKVVADLLHELPLLRVLSLSHLRISEVPESIGSLKHLRYLNLCRTRITYLPENVCNLYNLQTLIVSGCDKLNKLPESFSKLKNLRHFDITDTLLLEMPLGIGELKSLQTLSNIIIGGENGFAITELKNLQNLHGKVSIKGLYNVQNAMDAREANLSEKKFSELELHFGSKTHEKEVLHELKPHKDYLKNLEIWFYNGSEFPNWVGDPSFLWLAHVSIYYCDNFTSLPPLGQLPSLKKLVIDSTREVKVVGLELLGTGRAFPSLQILSFRCMMGWEEWSTTNSGFRDAVLFPCLQELSIEECPNLVKVSLVALPSLRVLKLRKCGHGVLTSLVDVASSVTRLEMDDITGLTDEKWRGVIGYLGSVEEVSIKSCDEIRYLWESEAEAIKVLVKLRRLEVWECSNLLSLGEKEGEDNCGSYLTSLTNLMIWDCNSLEHCSCPNSIESLYISGCDSVTSVSFPTGGGGQKLTSFGIYKCKNLMEKEFGGGEKTGVLINSTMHMLKYVALSCWSNMKSINELSCFIHLTTLRISECPSMESFPDHELPNLTSLTQLEILNCPSMDPCFPRGLWPPKLLSLSIGGLKKPISEWGPQYFPASLVDLTLFAGPCDGVSNFDELSHLLPSSLTILGINGFEKVESVSRGLQHLTSLQHLFISKCPMTKDLPEKLLPSLLSLIIRECPNLKKRSSRGGSYWPLVSLISRFQTDEQIQFQCEGFVPHSYMIYLPQLFDP